MNPKINCILLVDDNPADNAFHQLVIRKANFCDTVKVAMDGVEALEYLRNVGSPDYPKPDIVFLDINMPRMNGFEFLESHDKLPEIQKAKIVIVMLTTSLNPDDRKKAIEVGKVPQFMIKPLTVKHLEIISQKYFQ